MRKKKGREKKGGGKEEKERSENESNMRHLCADLAGGAKGKRGKNTDVL